MPNIQIQPTPKSAASLCFLSPVICGVVCPLFGILEILELPLDRPETNY